MKTALKTLAGTVGAIALALLLAPNSNAQCGGLPPKLMHPAAWQSQAGPARLLRAAYTNDDRENPKTDTSTEPIVGFWHVKFIAKGNAEPPDGTPIDAGYSQWHSDGTEIMNSGGRSPITSNFCLGVWEKVGERHYRLNHFATGWDPTGATLIGPANIKEEVTINEAGKVFEGTFTITQYDESLNVKAQVVGVIIGTRITSDTAPSSIF
jgi:hypothetical protein